MNDRCYRRENERYHRYGGRGIKVCDEWRGKHGFQSFMEWAYKSGYSKALTLDRIDNDRGYSPQNCRWASPKEQSNNRSNGRYITVSEVRQTVAQWSDQLGLKRPGIYKKSDEEIAALIQKALGY